MGAIQRVNFATPVPPITEGHRFVPVVLDYGDWRVSIPMGKAEGKNMRSWARWVVLADRSAWWDSAFRPCRPRAAARERQNQWRYTLHNGEWWYWLPAGRWVYWRDNRWNAYDPKTFLTPAPPALMRPVGPDRARGVSRLPIRRFAHSMAMPSPIWTGSLGSQQ